MSQVHRGMIGPILRPCTRVGNMHQDFLSMGVRDWVATTQNRSEQKAFVQVAVGLQFLYCQQT